VILFVAFFYVRYTVSYRDLEEIMAERGVSVDHATLNRWVAKYSPLIATNARRRKARVDRSWRMNETYIKVKGEWVCPGELSSTRVEPTPLGSTRSTTC
jgi:putative transposase